MSIQNPIILSHSFLADMYQDSYFPKHLVDQLKQTLLDLCQQIEAQKPQDLDALYVFTHAATEKINMLQEAFDEAESEIKNLQIVYQENDEYRVLESDIKNHSPHMPRDEDIENNLVYLEEIEMNIVHHD